MRPQSEITVQITLQISQDASTNTQKAYTESQTLRLGRKNPAVSGGNKVAPKRHPGDTQETPSMHWVQWAQWRYPNACKRNTEPKNYARSQSHPEDKISSNQQGFLAKAARPHAVRKWERLDIHQVLHPAQKLAAMHTS